MQFPKDVASLLAMISKLPQQKIAKGVSALMLVYLAYLSAELTWLMIPQDNNSFNASSYTYKPRGDESHFKVNIETLSALNLFGDHSGKSPVVEEDLGIQDAPETSLNLTLSGLVATDDQSSAAAIIENSGSQDTYGVGDLITGTRAMLESVMTDRVIIKVSGRLETLMLDGFEYGKSSPKVSRVPKSNKSNNTRKDKNKVIDKRSNKEFSAQAHNFRKDINANPGKITDYLKILPRRKSGEIIGYSLRPGKNPEFFKSSGLKSGDIAVQMNGYDLVQPMEAAQALKALKTEKEVSLLLDRDGEMTEIIFSVN